MEWWLRHSNSIDLFPLFINLLIYFGFLEQINELRSELNLRNLNSKGFRTQLIPRLTIALKAEAEGERQKQENITSLSDEESSQESLIEADESRRLDFAAAPQILVHPSRTAKGGKFNCALVSLSVLLDYRPEDTKVIFDTLWHSWTRITGRLRLILPFAIDRSTRSRYRSSRSCSTRCSCATSGCWSTARYRATPRGKRSEKAKRTMTLPTGRRRRTGRRSSTSRSSSPSATSIWATATTSPPRIWRISFSRWACSCPELRSVNNIWMNPYWSLSNSNCVPSPFQVRKLLQKVITDDSLRYRRLVERSVSTSKEDEDNADSLALSGWYRFHLVFVFVLFFSIKSLCCCCCGFPRSWRLPCDSCQFLPHSCRQYSRDQRWGWRSCQSQWNRRETIQLGDGQRLLRRCGAASITTAPVGRIEKRNREPVQNLSDAAV